MSLESKKLYAPCDVACILKMSIRQFWRYTKKPDFPKHTHKVGKGYRWNQEALQSIIDYFAVADTLSTTQA